MCCIDDFVDKLNLNARFNLWILIFVFRVDVGLLLIIQAGSLEEKNWRWNSWKCLIR